MKLPISEATTHISNSYLYIGYKSDLILLIYQRLLHINRTPNYISKYLTYILKVFIYKLETPTYEVREMYAVTAL